jgi:hypothetical protein
MFPKIFNELDKYQKAFTESHWKETGKLPPWLAEYEVSELLSVPEYGKFIAKHECGVDVSGVTDHLFRLAGSDKNVLFDYKTSRPSGDKMFDIYKAQLGIYAWISPRFGLGEISQMALVYYEPMTMGANWKDIVWTSSKPSYDPDMVPDVVTIEGFKLNFRPFVLKIEPIDINPLVLRAKALAEGDMPEPSFHCMECARVMEWVRVINPPLE